MEKIKVRNLTFTYPEGSKPAIRDVSFELAEGEIMCVLGPTGCGKTTLLRLMKPLIAPHGTQKGIIEMFGKGARELSQKEQACRIGFVMQNPDNQIVTDKVWHELAFGLENMGETPEGIRLRVAEIAGFFGIESWYDQMTSELSGGQKQLLNLAATMVMAPDLLILDEPTSQLDPVAAADFLAAVSRVNLELGTTIIITEHRAQDVISIADTICVMEDGRVVADGTPKEIAELAVKGKTIGGTLTLMDMMPETLFAFCLKEGGEAACKQVLPLDVPSGRRWLKDVAKKNEKANNERATVNGGRTGERPDSGKSQGKPESCSISLSNVWFRYEKDREDVLRGIELKAYSGKVLAITGGNGAGKSTLLSLIAGAERPYRGRVDIRGECVALPQDPQLLFTKDAAGSELEGELKCDAFDEVAKRFGVKELAASHPYDLSGGEQQRLALAKVFLSDGDIYVLDEPTKGLDAHYKRMLADAIADLARSRKTVIVVSHDMAFCARVADTCAMMFDGEIISEDTVRGFFRNNMYYTTQTGRMSRGIADGILLPEDIAEAFVTDTK